MKIWRCQPSWIWPEVDFTIPRPQRLTMHTYIHMSKIRQYAAELLMTERAFMPFDWHRYSGPCSNVRYLGNSTHLCLLTYLLSRPIFPGAMLSGLVLTIAFTELYEMWRGHRPIEGAWKACLVFPIGCLLSKPNAVKTPFCIFYPFKIRRWIGEITDSVFRRMIYAPNACFRFPKCFPFWNKSASEATDRRSRPTFVIFDTLYNWGRGERYMYIWANLPVQDGTKPTG